MDGVYVNEDLLYIDEYEETDVEVVEVEVVIEFKYDEELKYGE